MVHPQRLEHVVLEICLERLPRDDLHEAAEDHVVGIGVVVCHAGSGHRRDGGQVADSRVERRRGLREGRDTGGRRNAAGLLKQLADGDLVQLRGVRERELGEVPPDGRVDVDGAALGELAHREGGDPLRHRPEEERRLGVDGSAGGIGRAEPGCMHEAVANDDDGRPRDAGVPTLGVEPGIDGGIGGRAARDRGGRRADEDVGSDDDDGRRDDQDAKAVGTHWGYGAPWLKRRSEGRSVWAAPRPTSAASARRPRVPSPARLIPSSAPRRVRA